MTEITAYYEVRPVGRIEIHEDGPSFVYDPKWLITRGAFPISLQIPLSSRRIPPAVFVPWAANLLPEGKQLQAVGRTLGAAPEDVIRILSEIGRDTAGALSIGQPGTGDPGNWRPISDEAALERIINELPRKPFLAGEDGVSMSLAGVQSKIGIAINEHGQLCIPLEGAPSTYILKPDSEPLYGSVQNEALCLVLARLCGLYVPAATTGKAGDRSYLLVERYDRLQQGGRWRRLHQEDFCQALGKPPAAKYESNDTGVPGPKLADLFALTRNAMRAPDLINLLDYVIFNVLACNTDAHAKNYSILISGQGFKLAPIYDVMCANVWEGVTRNLAQKIAGKNRGEHLKLRHWQKFAQECGLNPTSVVRRVSALARKVMQAIPAAVSEVSAMPAGPHPLTPHIANAIEQRARAVIAGLTETADDAPTTDSTPAKTKTPQKKPTDSVSKARPKKPQAAPAEKSSAKKRKSKAPSNAAS